MNNESGKGRFAIFVWGSLFAFMGISKFLTLVVFALNEGNFRPNILNIEYKNLAVLGASLSSLLVFLIFFFTFNKWIEKKSVEDVRVYSFSSNLYFYSTFFFMVSLMGIVMNHLNSGLTNNEKIIFDVNGWVFIISYFIIGPIEEELMFRFVLIRALSFIKNYFLTALIGSVLFSSLHPTFPLNHVFLFILSMFSCYAIRRKGGLLFCIFLHMLYNVIALTIGVF